MVGLLIVEDRGGAVVAINPLDPSCRIAVQPVDEDGDVMLYLYAGGPGAKTEGYVLSPEEGERAKSQLRGAGTMYGGRG